jgi:hypothetical protein
VKPIDVLHDPQKAREVAAADLPQFIAAIGVLRDRAEVAFAALTARVPWAYRDDATEAKAQTGDPERIVLIEEAARLLGTSVDTLYDKWRKLPFAYKDPLDGKVKFRISGIEKYIQRRTA